jgi:hypothetical protein
MLTVTHGVKSDYVAFTYTSVDGGVPVTPDIVGRSVLVHDVSEDSWQYAQIVGMGETADTTYIFMDRRLLEGGAGENSLPFVENEPDMFYPGEAGMGGRDVYATLVMGDNAYGTTELSGGGLQHIVKQLGSAGTADPLNQRATVGWKATKAATRLVEAFMVRIETASTFGNGEA